VGRIVQDRLLAHPAQKLGRQRPPQSRAPPFAGWAGEVTRTENAGFIDLNELIARRLDVLGKEKVDLLYVPNPKPEKPKGETVHPAWDGAVLNAEVVVSGLKALKENPVAGYFAEKARSVVPAAR
jgi:hypothetical protein